MKLIRKLYGHGQNGLILTSTEAIPGSSSVDTQLLTSGKQENTTANYSCYHPWFHKSCTLVDQVSYMVTLLILIFPYQAYRIFFLWHGRKGKWDSGGHCHEERQPVTNDTLLKPYPLMMKILESVISEMKTPVFYLNITRMTGYRKDGHPSVYRKPNVHQRIPGIIQDCSHWCLPGVPDSWNELFYATYLLSHHDLSSNH